MTALVNWGIPGSTGLQRIPVVGSSVGKLDEKFVFQLFCGSLAGAATLTYYMITLARELTDDAIAVATSAAGLAYLETMGLLRSEPQGLVPRIGEHPRKVRCTGLATLSSRDVACAMAVAGVCTVNPITVVAMCTIYNSLSTVVLRSLGLERIMRDRMGYVHLAMGAAIFCWGYYLEDNTPGVVRIAADEANNQAHDQAARVKAEEERHREAERQGVAAMKAADDRDEARRKRVTSEIHELEVLRRKHQQAVALQGCQQEHSTRRDQHLEDKKDERSLSDRCVQGERFGADMELKVNRDKREQEAHDAKHFGRPGLGFRPQSSAEAMGHPDNTAVPPPGSQSSGGAKKSPPVFVPGARIHEANVSLRASGKEGVCKLEVTKPLPRPTRPRLKVNGRVLVPSGVHRSSGKGKKGARVHRNKCKVPSGRRSNFQVSKSKIKDMFKATHIYDDTEICIGDTIISGAELAFDLANGNRIWDAFEAYSPDDTLIIDFYDTNYQEVMHEWGQEFYEGRYDDMVDEWNDLDEDSESEEDMRTQEEIDRDYLENRYGPLIDLRSDNVRTAGLANFNNSATLRIPSHMHWVEFLQADGLLNWMNADMEGGKVLVQKHFIEDAKREGVEYFDFKSTSVLSGSNSCAMIKVSTLTNVKTVEGFSELMSFPKPVGAGKTAKKSWINEDTPKRGQAVVLTLTRDDKGNVYPVLVQGTFCRDNDADSLGCTTTFKGPVELGWCTAGVYCMEGPHPVFLGWVAAANFADGQVAVIGATVDVRKAIHDSDSRAKSYTMTPGDEIVDLSKYLKSFT